ncbi:hypothetical protein NXS19_009382 [Fusarium pseudograminearum]|uniref:Uncharacterized protein n=1 Tax=Fusarium pseudograminearum (strain CS3096) TaxID=1028729 RepID=K3VH05_FUSPC|nr:hypothetical protein FPSE_06275 [Fusarium pseudograminearum CS3096]EKJ73657.1 hypothetical protein FPSE_06275 [Fusarium pseudograminearum CS3096]KAF0644109.1 hypothetical protein FPSE5266_06275 [Fusarium pseudograminearum]UZP41566.1 hypothetical protein NXS19_009382 [Fusarium pseudograminearum]
MSSKEEKSTNGASRRQSQASMGNFGNESLDRSEETVLTRRQKRQLRRETLRLQAEVAPFMGINLDDEEDVKDEENIKDEDETKVEEKTEVEKKEEEEPAKNVCDTPLDTVPEVDETLVDDRAVLSGLRPDAFKIPPSGESEFPGQEKWWTRGIMGMSIRT